MSDNTRYTEALDRLLQARELVEETKNDFSITAHHAAEMIVWMTTTGKPGEALLHAREGVASVGSIADLQVASLKTAEEAFVHAASGIAKQKLYRKISSSEEDRTEAQQEVEEGVWFSNRATEEVLALSALYEEEAARLESLLIL
jgi:hypothetical protein